MTMETMESVAEHDMSVVGDAGGGEFAAASTSNHQFIAFTVGTESYGIDIMSVREIKGWTDVTTLPNQPPHMRGVLNLRGVVVPIFDLRCRFTGKMTDATERHVVIITAIGDRIVGILVDTVSDILSVSSADMRDVPSTSGRDDQDFLMGLVTSGDRMVAILALDRLIGGRDLTSTTPNASAA
jgi:purine-binding chemotaxis protein CheW